MNFTDTTGALLYIDDPAYNSKNGVFFAQPGTDFTVETNGAGVRSTRPLSVAPARFLTLEDGDFVAMQEA